jgi:signal transduction histidine kinase
MLEGLREREGLREEILRREDELRASRARVVAASDAERRRVERNIHDGAQQQLVALALKLRTIEERVGDDPDLKRAVGDAGERLKSALSDLRELARGLHPSILTTDGLPPALEQLAARAPLPVSVSAPERRFPEAVESTAYFVVCEALANVDRYAEASRADVSVEARNGRLRVAISDDGVGGADAGAGSGLTGLADRVAALDGSLTVASPEGEGTKVTAEIPIA